MSRSNDGDAGDPTTLYLRPDFPTKSGGDLVLARQFEAALRESGQEASLEPVGAAALRQGRGAAVLFNVDRYFELAAAARALHAAARPYAVSPIHHPTAFVDSFEHSRRPGGLRAIAEVGRTAYGRERIKHVLRSRSFVAMREAAVGDIVAAVRQALAQASLIVLQAPSEGEQLRSTFGVDLAAKSVWVPNGVTVDLDVSIAGERDIDLLLAGRIEERKNQLAVARAFAGTTFRVVFVGADNPRNAAYAAEFHSIVEQHANLTSLPHVSLDELRVLYSRSKALFSASRFEVVSLAELEAVAYGCRLVSTTSGYMRDYLGEHADYLDPDALPEVMRDAASRAVAQGVNHEGMAIVRRDYTWARTHRVLAEGMASAGLMTRRRKKA